MISTHTPLAGCNCLYMGEMTLFYNFYSHTPCGVQPYVFLLIIIWSNFYSHTPCGVQLQYSQRKLQLSVFLLTHPLRGATVKVRVCGLYHGISTHTPLAGCNTGCSRKWHGLAHFYSHTPCGVQPYS